MGMRAISFGGTVFMGLLDSNKLLVGGFRKVGNMHPLTIGITTEQKKQLSAMKESHGQNLHTKTSISEITGAGTFQEYDADVLAWALAGEKVALTGVGGTESAESVTLLSGEWVKLAHKGVSDVVITGSVLNTDFQVNETLGLIRMMPEGNLTAVATDVAYAYAAESDYQIKVGTTPQVRVALLLDGVDLETGADFSGEFDSVVISSNSEIELISDPDADFGSMPFDFSFETLTGKDSPGTINGIPASVY
ncbi:MAG: hypothetical protein ACI8PB_002901 [Desulforhopalus sp.]|jgi:hypothetical protein